MLCKDTWPNYRLGNPKDGVQLLMKVSKTIVAFAAIVSWNLGILLLNSIFVY